MYVHLQQDLLQTAPVRDKVRLFSEGRQHSGAWLSVVPNTNLGSNFDKGEFLLLTHFHFSQRQRQEPPATNSGRDWRPPHFMPEGWCLEAPHLWDFVVLLPKRS